MCPAKGIYKDCERIFQNKEDPRGLEKGDAAELWERVTGENVDLLSEDDEDGIRADHIDLEGIPDCIGPDLILDFLKKSDVHIQENQLVPGGRYGWLVRGLLPSENKTMMITVHGRKIGGSGESGGKIKCHLSMTQTPYVKATLPRGPGEVDDPTRRTLDGDLQRLDQADKLKDSNSAELGVNSDQQSVSAEPSAEPAQEGAKNGWNMVISPKAQRVAKQNAANNMAPPPPGKKVVPDVKKQTVAALGRAKTAHTKAVKKSEELLERAKASKGEEDIKNAVEAEKEAQRLMEKVKDLDKILKKILADEDKKRKAGASISPAKEDEIPPLRKSAREKSSSRQKKSRVETSSSESLSNL